MSNEQRKQQNAEHQNQQGNVYFKLQQYGNAINFYDNAVRLCPSVAKYWHNRSACRMMMGQYIQALHDARRSVDLDNNYTNGYVKVAKCNKKLDDLNSAFKALERAKTLKPDDDNILSEFEHLEQLRKIDSDAKEYLKNKKYQEALEHIKKYLNLMPESKFYTLQEAQCLVNLQKFTEANEIIVTVLQHYPEDEDALYTQALCDYYKSYIAESFEDVKKIKMRIPDHLKTAKLYKNAKVILELIDKYNEALDASENNDAHIFLDAAIKTDPNNLQTNKILCFKKIVTALKCNELKDKIIEDCKFYINNYGTNIQVLKYKAKQHEEIQEYEEALLDYETIIKLENTEENRKVHDKLQQLVKEQDESIYKILQIDEAEDDITKIKKARDELLLKYHVDRNHNATPEEKKRLETKVMKINKAFNTIKEKLNKMETPYKDEEDKLTETPRENEDEEDEGGALEETEETLEDDEVPVHLPKHRPYTINDIKLMIAEEDFERANKAIKSILNQMPNDEEALYVQALCQYYSGYIEKTFENLCEIQKKNSDITKIVELHKKAEDTMKIIFKFNDAIKYNKQIEAYNYLTEAIKIDPENKITNKNLLLQKIIISSKNANLISNIDTDTTNYINQFGPDAEVLKIRGKINLENQEYVDAMEDYQELLNLEDIEENKKLYEEAERLFQEENECDWKILKINKNDIKNEEKVKKAFYDLLLQYHPDKHATKATAERKRKLEKKVIRIREAFNRLLEKIKK